MRDTWFQVIKEQPIYYTDATFYEAAKGYAKSDYVEYPEEALADICLDVRDRKGGLSIVDFSFVQKIAPNESVFQDLIVDKKTLLLNVPNDLYVGFKNIAGKKKQGSFYKCKLVKNINGLHMILPDNMYVGALLKYLKIDIYTPDEVLTLSEKIIEAIVAGFLYEKREDRVSYISSSNLYSNQYINIKSMFGEVMLMRLVVFRMKDIVKKLCAGKNLSMEDVSLIGVSTNGSIIAKLLAKELGTKVDLINRLGPRYCKTTTKPRKTIIEQKSHIFVADFVCIGSELKRTKQLSNQNNNRLIGCVSVAQLGDIYRNAEDRHLNKSILSLVPQINNSVLPFDYRLSFDKNDFKTETIEPKDPLKEEADD